MPENYLAKRKKQAMRGVVNGTVSRLLIDVKGFKVNPHRVRGIGNSAMGECVGHQKIAEFVMDPRVRHWFDGQHRHSGGEGEQKNSRDRQPAERSET